jgi:signal transduction histidine kinase
VQAVIRKDPLVDLLIHDLTGPLSIVSTSINNLLSKEGRFGPIPDAQRETLERILRNANKAKALLQEMIEVYRSEEGLFRKDEIVIAEVLREALLDAVEIIDPGMASKLSGAGSEKGFTDILSKNGISIEVSGRYGQSPFIHDRKKIQQIMRNLITNALKYRKKMMKLAISGDLDLVITVGDDGEGIPQEKQDYIFKRFFHLNNKTECGVEGLGFGLSCVKSLVETMRGEITLKSGEGEGSCFTVRIPSL